MKKSILCLAVIAALACVVCNDGSVSDSGKKGAADAFLDSFLDTAVTYYSLNVEINPAGGGTVSRNPNETRYKAGDTVIVTAQKYDGYEFTGWTGASNKTTVSVIIIMNSDLTLTANFIPIITTYYTLDVSVSPVGYGTVSRSPNKTDYTAGEQVKVTAAAKPGYVFTGWSGALNNTTDTMTVTMSRDLSLTANFQVEAYTLTLTANPPGGGSVSAVPDKKTYGYEDEVTVTAEAAAAEGYWFIGWSGASIDTADTIKITLNGSKALTANFITWDTEYTVTFDANNGNGTPPGPQTVSAGDSITLPGGNGLTKGGFKFGGWNTDSNGTGVNYNGSTPYKPTADVNLYAKWTPLDRYTVTFNSQGGTGVNSIDVVDGDWCCPYWDYECIEEESGDFKMPAEPARRNYKFEGWYAEAACINVVSDGIEDKTGRITVFTVISDTTLYAKWAVGFTDSRDGKVYKKVTIGTQTWMAENLNYDVPNNVKDVCYGNSVSYKESNCKAYGRLYNWSTAMDIGAEYNRSLWGSDVKHRGVCPAGWHLPSDAEWTTLVEYVGVKETAGTKLKSKPGYNYWGASGCLDNGGGYGAYASYGADDEYGFSAYLGGRYSGNRYYNIGTSGYWWSATEYSYSTDIASWRSMSCSAEEVWEPSWSTSINKDSYCSVRCVMD